MGCLKSLVNLGLSFVVGFYTAFVLMMLWDWFITPAFHVTEIGYFNVYGLVLVVRLLSPTADAIAVAQQGERETKMLEACIPDGKRAETLSAIEKDSLSNNAQMLLANGMEALGSTMSLVVGFVVHTFLM